MSQDVAPTRSEELRLKERIELAENGHGILEKKRDGLIHEFMQVVGEARSVNEELADRFSSAKEALDEARVFDGEQKLRASALGSADNIEIESDTRNIMGVVVPEIESDEIRTDVLDRNYSVSGSSGHIDAAADEHEKLLEKIIEAAEIQTKVLKLLDEIEKTKRRVNALEHKTIPELNDSLSYVSQTLMEEEREETFRMKKIKDMQDDQ